MPQTTLNLKLDSELKDKFTEHCKREGRSVSLVIRELMKTHLKFSSDEHYDADFYAHIDKAMQSPLVPMSREELRALHRAGQ